MANELSTAGVLALNTSSKVTARATSYNGLHRIPNIKSTPDP